MDIVDLDFSTKINGILPADHGYALFASLCRLVPDLHADRGIGVHPINGSLRFRCPIDRARLLSSLIGRRLQIDSCLIDIGQPRVIEIAEVTRLRCHFATTKNGQDRSRFEAEIRRQIGLDCGFSVDNRSAIRVRDKLIVGYAVTVENGSVQLQQAGIGGRRHFGCGLLAPC